MAQALGVWDFAGGIVIHTTAGMATIAAGLVFGRRKNYGPQIMVLHNLPPLIMGITMLWLGWFGFNAGSAFTANGVAGNALLTSQIGSATCKLVWLFLSWKRSGTFHSSSHKRCNIWTCWNYTYCWLYYWRIRFCSWYHSRIWFLLWYILLKEKLRIDDALDVGSVHGITGILGALTIGVAASPLVMPNGPVGWLYGNPAQLGIQAFGIAVAAAFAFAVSIAIL